MTHDIRHGSRRDSRRGGTQDDRSRRQGDTALHAGMKPHCDTRVAFHPWMRRPRWHDYTAFILSGGGARGALQAGALRALLEQGIQPDVVIGTSIGSWNGAWLAAQPTLAGAERLVEIWQDVHTGSVLLGRQRRVSSPAALNSMLLSRAARRLVGGAPSLYGNLGLRRLLERSFADLTFEDLAIPLGVVAVDLTHGNRTVFERGPVVPALLASSAIPGIFPPVRIGDAYYCDGSDLDDASFVAALALGARRIYILAIAHDIEGDGGNRWACAPSTKQTNRTSRIHHRDESGVEHAWSPRHVAEHPLAAVLERASQVRDHYQLEQALQRLPAGIERHIISLRTGNGAGILDFSSIAMWLEAGYDQARAYLESDLPPHMSQTGVAEVAARDQSCGAA